MLDLSVAFLSVTFCLYFWYVCVFGEGKDRKGGGGVLLEPLFVLVSVGMADLLTLQICDVIRC